LCMNRSEKCKLVKLLTVLIDAGKAERFCSATEGSFVLDQAKISQVITVAIDWITKAKARC
jgi:hypothetical protein